MFSTGLIVSMFSVWGYVYNEEKSRNSNSVIFNFDNGKEIQFQTWHDAEDWIRDVSD